MQPESDDNLRLGLDATQPELDDDMPESDDDMLGPDVDMQLELGDGLQAVAGHVDIGADIDADDDDDDDEEMFCTSIYLQIWSPS